MDARRPGPPRHPLYNPFAHDTPKQKRDGTRAEVTAMYRARLLERPELLERVEALRGKTLACWCAPSRATPTCAELADSAR
ncbi:DUF4326 domain-containing protein [Streptomyces sp. NPDC000345]|uniref:DUF4326 domain-containing protein n=1 Tax=Streptomyces sp. NPDC000345 TaxID=3364537 RepID=UPI003695111A